MAQNNSLSILEVVTKSSLFLQRKGVPNHKIDAEWLMAHALGCQRMELYLRFGEILTETLLEKIRALVVKRGERVPLQHILGYVPFAGLKLKCDKRALVPRYETEYLVDCINQKLSTKFCGRIADLGCGGGAIILALCNQMPEACGVGFDRSSQALALANENCFSSNLKQRVTFKHFDWLDSVSLDCEYDLIVSNPPYLSQNEWLSSEPEVQLHDPKTALVADNNGFSDIKRIVSIAENSLKKGGRLAIEFGNKQAPLVEQLLDGNFTYEIISDQHLVRRFVFASKN